MLELDLVHTVAFGGLVLLGGAVVGAVATWEAIGRGTPVETLFWVLFMLGSIAAISSS